MNLPIAIVATLTLLAFFLHISGGVYETLQIKPSRILDDQKNSALTSHNRIWTQSMCSFQMLGIDLLLMAIVLYLLAATDVIAHKQTIALICASVFLLWGIVWFLQMAFLKRPAKEYLQLPHWAIWFACSAIVYYGSKQFV